MGGSINPPLPVEMSYGLPLLGRLLNYQTAFTSMLIAFLMVLVAYIATRKLRKFPGRFQVAVEAFVAAFDQLVTDVLGKGRGRKYLPLVGTLFLFITLSNMAGIIPFHSIPIFSGEGFEIGGEPVTVDRNLNGRYDPGDGYDDLDGDGHRTNGFLIPPPKEPTSDLNVPLGLALIFFFLGLGSQIYIRGPLSPIKDLFMDMGPFDWSWRPMLIPSILIMGFFQIFMFFLSVVGKFAEVVSVSFRLFGNIFGGVVILAVIGGLLEQLLLPIGLTFFFGIFVGIVQAFVFTMLNLTYLSLAMGED